METRSIGGLEKTVPASQHSWLENQHLYMPKKLSNKDHASADGGGVESDKEHVMWPGLRGRVQTLRGAPVAVRVRKDSRFEDNCKRVGKVAELPGAKSFLVGRRGWG